MKLTIANREGTCVETETKATHRRPGSLELCTTQTANIAKQSTCHAIASLNRLDSIPRPIYIITVTQNLFLSTGEKVVSWNIIRLDISEISVSPLT
jgi:hypothetical protein